MPITQYYGYNSVYCGTVMMAYLSMADLQSVDKRQGPHTPVWL